MMLFTPTAFRLALSFTCLLLLVNSCTTNNEPESVGTVEGYRPVYVSYEDMRRITTQSPKPLKNPGKIYVHGSYLFINEQGEGIHIINNQNPAQPQALAFVAIPGNVDMAVKGTILYADNAIDLIALDISNPQQVEVVHRTENAFPYASYPPHTGISFECVDQSRGVVVGWEKVMLNNPRCRR